MARKAAPDQARDASDRWEDEGGFTGRRSCNGELGELERLGIKSLPLIVYEWGGYRYTNASDAIAAAKRGAKA